MLTTTQQQTGDIRVRLQGWHKHPEWRSNAKTVFFLSLMLDNLDRECITPQRRQINVKEGRP